MAKIHGIRKCEFVGKDIISLESEIVMYEKLSSCLVV